MWIEQEDDGPGTDTTWGTSNGKAATINDERPPRKGKKERTDEIRSVNNGLWTTENNAGGIEREGPTEKRTMATG